MDCQCLYICNPFGGLAQLARALACPECFRGRGRGSTIRKLLGLKVLAYIRGGLAQLARALAWHARGRRFDPDTLHKSHL